MGVDENVSCEEVHVKFFRLMHISESVATKLFLNPTQFVAAIYCLIVLTGC